MSVHYDLVAPSSPSERVAASLAHGGTALAWFLAPLAVYLLARGQSPQVERHALEALLWSLAGTVVAFLTCGLAVPVFLAFHLLAAWRAYHGEAVRYPLLTDALRRRG